MRTAADSTRARAAVLVLLVVVGLVAVAAVDLPDVATARGWVDAAGPWGWTGMVTGVALVLLAPVPRSAVSVLVGVLAGFPAGVAVALAGGLLGGLAAFGLSRGLGRPAVARFAGRGLARVDRLMAERGFWALLLGRLLPVVPFVALSYGAGLTAVRLTPTRSPRRSG
ncbi:TVP38/TMEM64 family protein [Blastococcus brunescens]|uniref:TVP38/TMEM64 family membrane protein n=1 Tax=Blastococcus brunescens TaxID=1564165 RepID=A0ABZ1B4W6_9ACTN|nr:VTT domain-containing protein [Blastococcus sp. BMG 8361]WRL65774.1 VTT domain-containing protein [Blastococcus sp. BMG 8361]